eukprot:gb/GECH01013473.1/.p1 GENE.gb/GECH01013473.1/~~gb/GECH01013473.1/.p1  ORF type:complete len:211 (+),score=61.95 gb/GECH01013473.1/:1-633(+)
MSSKEDIKSDNHMNNTTREESTNDEEKTHKLEHSWTLWFDKRSFNKDVSWEENLKCIGTFSTVEDFWSYFNFIKKPSEIPMGANYHLFKEGVKPMWEDEINKNGGKWIIVLKRNLSLDVNEFWEKLVLSMIGETIDVKNEICGAVVSRRKAGDKIALWNKTKDNEEVNKAIGEKLRDAISLPENVKMEYQHHEDSLKSGTSYTNMSRLVL